MGAPRGIDEKMVLSRRRPAEGWRLACHPFRASPLAAMDMEDVKPCLLLRFGRSPSPQDGRHHVVGQAGGNVSRSQHPVYPVQLATVSHVALSPHPRPPSPNPDNSFFLPETFGILFSSLSIMMSPILSEPASPSSSSDPPLHHHHEHPHLQGGGSTKLFVGGLSQDTTCGMFTGPLFFLHSFIHSSIHSFTYPFRPPPSVFLRFR